MATKKKAKPTRKPVKKRTVKKRTAKKSATKKSAVKTVSRPARRGPRSAAQRVSVLLVMLPWIMQRQRVKISTMARQFNLTEAELIEDLQMAAVCGVPPYTPDALIDVYMDNGMVIAEVPLVFSRPLKLSTAELFAVSVMAQTAMQLPGANKKGPLASALTKLAPLMPSGAETIKVQLPKARFVKELLTAASSGERQEIEYFSPATQKRTMRTITARKVFEDAGRWYVAADDHLSGEDRVFRVDRIEQLSGTEIFDQLREVRDDELPWFSESLQQVTLRVQKSARWIVESYPYVSRVDNADGSVDLTMSVTSSHWLGRLLLRAGKGVKVLKPAQHKNLATETARSVLSRYSASNVTSNSAS
jgi:proteasome accessory factor C